MASAPSPAAPDGAAASPAPENGAASPLTPPTPPPPLTGEAALTERVARMLAPTFDLDREIGRGGMGIVYRAVDRRLKRPVAVKVLPPELSFRSDIRSRFLQEAETAAQLSHPDIVPIYTVDERDGLVYFVMAYVDGQTLAQYLKSTGGPLPVREARRILREIGTALSYAHAHGVIHRDIKPDNILLSKDGGRAMVTDFGIARAVTATGDSRLTATGVAIGTPAYMSPEQCAGDREVDGRSDLYSLGVVAYQMLTGSLPFSGGNTAALLVKQLSEAPIPLRQRAPGVPAGLAAAVMRLLAKDPSARFADADAFLAAMDNDAAPAADPPSPHPPATAYAPAPSFAPFPGSDGSYGHGPPSAAAIGPAGPVPPAPWPLSSPAPPQFSSPPLAGVFGAADVRSRVVNAVVTAALTKAERRAARKQTRDRQRGDRILDSDPRIVKIRKFRQMAVSMSGTMAFLTALNLVTSPHFIWAIFPILGMGLGLHKAAGKLWADGITMGEVFGKRAREALATGVLPPTAGLAPGIGSDAGVSSAARLAPMFVLGGPYGGAVQRAAIDRDRIRDIVRQFDKRELSLVPNAAATADGLADQVGALAGALHRIDVETPPEQRAAFAQRRAEMVAQMDRASMLLQTLYFDVLRLRMSGAGAEGIAGVTEQASALSRDIGYVVGAADELRALDRESRDR